MSGTSSRSAGRRSFAGPTATAPRSAKCGSTPVRTAGTAARTAVPDRRLAAAHVLVALDLAADQGAEHAADDRAGGAFAARVDAAADEGADARADDEAGRAVAAAAIITAVLAAIDFILGAQAALLVTRVVAIIARRLPIGAVLPAVAAAAASAIAAIAATAAPARGLVAVALGLVDLRARGRSGACACCQRTSSERLWAAAGAATASGVTAVASAIASRLILISFLLPAT